MKALVICSLALMTGMAPLAAQAADAKATGSEKPAATETKPAAKSTAKPAAKPADDLKPAVVDSLGLLEHAVAKDSTKFDNLYRLGVMYLDRDRVNEAIRVLLKARSLKPKNNKVLVNLGAAYDAAGQPAQAQTYYKEALQISPGDSVATCRLASSLYSQANYKEAMRLLRSMIGKGTGAYCAYFTLGVAFADAGIYRDAIRMWKKVIEIAPESAEANSAKESIEVLEKFVNSK
jgi:tetratricopeptide (TPR) repeat protein